MAAGTRVRFLLAGWVLVLVMGAGLRTVRAGGCHGADRAVLGLNDDLGGEFNLGSWLDSPRVNWPAVASTPCTPGWPILPDTSAWPVTGQVAALSCEPDLLPAIVLPFQPVSDSLDSRDADTRPDPPPR